MSKDINDTVADSVASVINSMIETIRQEGVSLVKLALLYLVLRVGTKDEVVDAGKKFFGRYSGMMREILAAFLMWVICWTMLSTGMFLKGTAVIAFANGFVPTDQFLILPAYLLGLGVTVDNYSVTNGEQIALLVKGLGLVWVARLIFPLHWPMTSYRKLAVKLVYIAAAFTIGGLIAYPLMHLDDLRFSMLTLRFLVLSLIILGVTAEFSTLLDKKYYSDEERKIDVDKMRKWVMRSFLGFVALSSVLLITALGVQVVKNTYTQVSPKSVQAENVQTSTSVKGDALKRYKEYRCKKYHECG